MTHVKVLRYFLILDKRILLILMTNLLCVELNRSVSALRLNIHYLHWIVTLRVTRCLRNMRTLIHPASSLNLELRLLMNHILVWVDQRTSSLLHIVLRPRTLRGETFALHTHLRYHLMRRLEIPTLH